jgi:uncharacterized RDD family membrane protein YckC
LAAKLQPALQAVPDPSDAEPRKEPDLSRAVQASLFAHRPPVNVIPIQSYAPAMRPRSKASTSVKAPAKPSPRRASKTHEGQGKLDFLPAQQAKPRTLGTTVEAVIYCEAPVATALHRAVAAALDWSMILIGYGLFLLIFCLSGGEFDFSKTNLMVFTGALALIGLTYGLVWVLAGCESAGMRWMHLRLITFDGFPPDGRQRILRLAGFCLSLCTLAGLLWSLADEESLTWQDYISRTFPTPQEAEFQVFQRR